MWKNIVEWSGPHMTIRRKRIACWIPKATNIQSDYVILIAFQLQQLLHERTSMLLYTYIGRLVVDLKLLMKGCAPKNRKFKNIV
jgi:hypothetical protein